MRRRSPGIAHLVGIVATCCAFSLGALPAASAAVTAHQQRAEKLAAALLALAVLPPGSTRTNSLTPGANPSMRGVSSGPGRIDVAWSTGYWTVPLSPTATWQWVKGHPEHGAQLGDQNGGSFTGVETPCASGQAKEEQTIIFPRPAPAQAGLVVDVATCPVDGRTPVTVAAYTTWQPTRPRDSFIGHGVHALTVAVMGSAWHGAVKGPYAVAPHSVTTSHKVRALVDYVNHLETTVGVTSCPPTTATTTFVVEFRPSLLRAPSAVLVQAHGCGPGEFLVVRGRTVARLAATSGGRSMVREMQATTGITVLQPDG